MDNFLANRPNGRFICYAQNRFGNLLHFPLDFLLAGFLHHLSDGSGAAFLQPFFQILIAAGADTGLAFGVGTVLAFLFLLGLYDLSQVIAVLPAECAADFSVLPEKALSAVMRPLRVVSDTVDHNGFFLC